MEIFAVGTVWFFLLVVPVVFWMFACVENEKSFWATVTVVGTLLLLQFLGGVEVFTGIYENPEWFLFGVAGYIVIALVWSVGKWVFFARKKRHEYDQAMAVFREQYPDTSAVQNHYVVPRDGNMSPEELEEAKRRFIESNKPKFRTLSPMP